MNRKLILIVIGITLGLLGLLLILQALNRPEAPSPDELEGRESGTIEITAQSAQQIQNDHEKMKELLRAEEIDNENFRIFYDEANDTFTAQIYTGVREEQIENIYGYLEEQGITYPRRLRIEFVGPFSYEDYILTP